MSAEKDFVKIDDLKLPDGLLDTLNNAANLVKSTSTQIRVVSHYDADGLSAGAIICAALIRLNKPFHISLQHNLNPDSKLFTDLENNKNDLKLFFDMGSSRLIEIEKLGGWNVILDHHKTEQNTDANNIVHINSHLFGINGSYELCASTLAFLLSLSIATSNWDLISLAIAGAMGDKQHKNGFKGVNLQLVEQAVAQELIEERFGLKIFGNNITQAIVNSTDPYFIGLSNNESATKKLLESLQIDPGIKPEELDKVSLKKLVSYLILKLIEQGIPPEDAEELITTRYYHRTSQQELEEYSHIINSCGRMRQMGLGVAAALGDSQAFEQAIKLRSEYKIRIREGLKRLEVEGPKEMKNIQYFYEPTAEFAGTYAGLGMMYFFNQSKPVIALTKNEESINISGRGTKRLVNSGLDLAKIFATISPEFNGTGGGHQIAAGATIPMGTEEEFLTKVDGLVGEQLTPKNGD